MLSYKEIHQFDVELAKYVLENHGDFAMFYNKYLDPDIFPISNGEFKVIGDIKCTVDGLLSVKRIKAFEGFGEEFVSTFAKYRKTPILFFPSERGGLNFRRAQLLEDRPDHTLLDLKNKCNGATNCVLEGAYNCPKTKKWLESFGYNFELIVDSLGLKGSFVDENYNVYDLEKNDGSPLIELKESYISTKDPNYLLSWSSNYYNNLKKRIEIFEQNRS